MCEGDWFGLGWIEGTVSWDFLLLFFHDSNSSGPLMNGLRFYYSVFNFANNFFFFYSTAWIPLPSYGVRHRITPWSQAQWCALYRGVKLFGEHYIAKSCGQHSQKTQRCASHRRVKLRCVHHTEESNFTLQSKYRKYFSLFIRSSDGFESWKNRGKKTRHIVPLIAFSCGVLIIRISLWTAKYPPVLKK